MSITQTIEIPVDHRLILDVPREVPAGRARITVVSEQEKKRHFFSSLFTSKFSRHFDEFYGCFKSNAAFEGDSVEIIRKMREEWDRPGEDVQA